LFTTGWLQARARVLHIASMRWMTAVLALLLPLVLAACGGGGPVAAVPLPRYGIGDSYSFDDGSVRTVVGGERDLVYWRDNGAPVVTTHDVLLPPLAITVQGRTIRREVIGADLFPLVPGKHAIFVVTQRAADGALAGAAEETGECIVGGRSHTDTPGGTFDTIRVDCTAHEANSRRALHASYFYAPSIGYFVRRDEQTGDGPRHRIRLEHYAFGAPPLSNAALQRRTAAIQRALETRVSDSRVSWRNPSSGAGGTIEPVLTEHLPKLGWCREFRERIVVGDRHYDLLGTACRGRGGTWLVREITPYRAAS